MSSPHESSGLPDVVAGTVNGQDKNTPPEAADGLPTVSPDFVEATLGEELDNAVPTPGYQMLPMVGLGGSAGGIQALREFFGAMPADSGLAFVVVLHLSPEHDSTLAELLQRLTPMPVVQAQDGIQVMANCVYVIPPGKHLAAADGRLRLSPLQPERGTRVAVDMFFRTLADTHGPHAVAIVLSGADGDGAIGLKRIKERGGLTIAQDPEEAEHSGMPRSAIATQMVDWVLPIREMPGRLLEYARREALLKLPPEEGSQPAEPIAKHPDEAETALRNVLAYLRTRTARDFSYYKRATILRRIARRMQINGVDTMPEYLAFLRTHPGEAGALLQDLLISVTNFFRDREAFSELESRVPELFRDKGRQDTVRVWCPACATGEEAYSLAILLFERASKMESPPHVQVFATDLDEEAIQQARAGAYPATIAADVSEERLQRFFVKEQNGYRVRRDLREVVLFAWHDLLKDSPFSRLDLVSCRNLLIYLNRDAQRRAIDLFHFALQPEGWLFLGSAESVDEVSPFFTPLDKKHRIYARRSAVRTAPIGPNLFSRSLQAREEAAGGPTLPPEALMTAPQAEPGERAAAAEPGKAGSWGELHLRTFEQFGPASMLVDARHDIVHLSKAAGRYLQFDAGELTKSLLRAVHPMLRPELRATLHRAAQSHLPTATFDVPIDLDGQRRTVDIHVSPTAETAADFFLIVFQARPATAAASAEPPSAGDSLVQQLERETEGLKVHRREVEAQHDAASEEHKAANEELQAINEELRAASEELETGREELQSVNEELTTVNQELKSRVEELGRAISNLHNLMDATSIATIFLDRELRIMLYTPSSARLFRLIPGDIGRLFSDVKHQLDYPQLEEDAAQVLARLTPIEHEVRDTEGRWFLARLLPYRTLDHHIAGVVLAFVDISENRRAEEFARASEEQFRRAIEDAPIPVIIHAEDGQVLQISNAWTELTGYPREEMQTFDAWLNRAYGSGAEELRALVQRLFQGEERKFEAERDIITRHGERRRWAFSASSPGTLRDGQRFIVGMALDVTERRRVEDAWRESQERLRLIVENAREYAIFSLDLERHITSWNTGAHGILGYTQEEALGQSGDIIFTPEDSAAGAPQQEASTALAEGRAADERWHVRKDGSRFWGSGVMMAMHDQSGQAIGLVKIFRDQTKELHATKALEQSQAELREALQETERARSEVVAASEAKDHFLAVLSHELRTPLTPIVMALGVLFARRDLPPVVLKALEMIERNVQLESRFIDDLLDITRITRGKMEIVREDMDLHEAARCAAEISAPDIDAKGQQLTVALDATEHRLSGDSARLQQAMWNLLKNASKFTPEGGAIALRSHNEPGAVVIEVSDTGIGMEADALERVFNAFEQADATIARHFGGLGLGLAIAKATVDAHGGDLRASSAGRNLGATFTLRLPLSDEAPG